MSNYIQIEFQTISSEQSDLLIAQLSEIGFDGFEEEEKSLRAFIPENDFIEAAVKEITVSHNLSFTQSTIEETNWNAVWESNFQPVVVDDFVGIRADFHESLTGVEHEIVITPKMSFGTGHHATTFMMIQQMREIDFASKSVFDFGTGTGILSILAEKLGAAKIFAVDYDEWSIENAEENLKRNNCSKFELKKADNAAGEKQYDIILANINKNVILDNFSSLVKQLAPTGILLLSGLLETDETDILKEAGKYPLIFNHKIGMNKWMAINFSH
ncbi:MAG: 50S ribosomal protein L11 methyltransferase [Bacteroidota bacterium]|nr:50S ribosomal protein L11 methyltransferase [Bacteroidota bacterium]